MELKVDKTIHEEKEEDNKKFNYSFLLKVLAGVGTALIIGAAITLAIVFGTTTAAFAVAASPVVLPIVISIAVLAALTLCLLPFLGGIRSGFSSPVNFFSSGSSDGGWGNHHSHSHAHHTQGMNFGSTYHTHDQHGSHGPVIHTHPTGP